MKYNKIKLIALISFLTISINSKAQDVQITPLRFDLTQDKKNSHITISNNKKEILLLKNDIFIWEQENGFIKDGEAFPPKDKISPMLRENVSVYPKTMAIKPESSQIIRMKKNLSSEQKEYRVFLNEQPKSEYEQDIQFVNTFSLPVFLYDKPLSIKEYQNGFDKEIIKEKNKIFLKIQNKTNQTIKLNYIYEDNKEKIIGFYLLPNIIGYIELKNIPEILKINTDKGDLELNLENIKKQK